MEYVIKQLDPVTSKVTVIHKNKKMDIQIPKEHVSVDQKHSFLKGHQEAHNLHNGIHDKLLKIVKIQGVIIAILLLALILKHG